jgi:hypothetical protein
MPPALLGPRSRAKTRHPVSIGRLGTVLVLAAWVASAGCKHQSPAEAAKASLSDNSGLMLPPNFKPVNLPVDTRKQIFREAQRIRALAVREANAQLPMDESHLPIGDKPAFDKRVADHKAIIEGIHKTKFAALARQHNISTADLAQIEEEANLLRWTPPAEPTGAASGKPLYPEGAKPDKPDAGKAPAEPEAGKVPAEPAAAPSGDAKASQPAKSTSQ